MSRIEIASFINALFYVYYLLIFVRIVFSWIGIPSGALLSIYRFVFDVTEPYLRIFRRIIPLAGPIDFSPIIAMLALGIIQRIVLGAL